MKAVFLIFITCLLSNYNGKSQTTNVDSFKAFSGFENLETPSKSIIDDSLDQVFTKFRHTLDSAAVALKHQDTLQAIRILHILEAQYPKDANLKMIKYNIGILYLENGQLQRAKQHLTQMVKEPFFYEGFGIMAFRSESEMPNVYNFRATLKLVEIAITERNFEAAKNWLSKAETDCFPKTGCANGTNLYLNESALVYAKYYCAIGDTTHAIERLMNDYFNREGCYDTYFTTSLKTLLKSKYAQKVLSQEIQKGIASINNALIIENKRFKYNFSFTIFGSTIFVKDYDFSDEDHSPEIVAHLKEKLNILAH